MNNNEAVGLIRFMLDVGGSDGFTSADKEALNMAINALSAEVTAPPKSNGDRIRQMTDEELAKILCFAECEVLCPAIDNEHCNGDCCGHFLRWLKQEASEDATD